MKYIVDIEKLEEYIEPDKSEFTGPILPGYHFYWEEVRGTDGQADEYCTVEDLIRWRNNAILEAIMLEVFRGKYKRSIAIQSWGRSDYYNDVILPSMGYESSSTSDHKDARAADTDVPVRQTYINWWKDICRSHNVYPSIGLYKWGMHLGFRYDREAFWDYR